MRTALGCAALALLLSGCTVAAATPSEGERGDGQVVPPLDGEFISQRAAVALAVDDEVDREPVEEAALAAAAALDHDPQLTYASVLRSATAGTRPHITVVLEEGTAAEEAQHVLDELATHDAAAGVLEQHAVTVYAHDIVLTADVDDGPGTAEALALEGILFDALGFHEVEAEADRVTIRYVGPLLSTSQLDSAVTAVARAGAVDAEAVRLSAGTPGDPVAWEVVDDPFAEVERLQRAEHGHDG
jgi:hypothetical protein